MMPTITPDQAKQLARLAELHRSPMQLQRDDEDDPLMVTVNPNGLAHSMFHYLVTPNGSVLKAELDGWRAA